MAIFVRGLDTHLLGGRPLINLDHVAKMQPVVAKSDGSIHWICYASDGREIGKISAADMQKAAPDVVVPPAE